MKTSPKTKFPKNEEGQILPWMALLMIVFVGAAGLTIDLGRGWVAYRQLQTAADAAALAGVNAMAQNNATASTVQSAVCQFSANGSASNNCTMIAGTTTTTTKAGVNTAPGLNSVSTTATLLCVTGKAYVTSTCDASNTGYNVLRVVETTTIPTFFIQALQSFGIKPGNSLTMNSTSTATINGSMAPVDVAILVDTTNSMGQNDPTHCGGTAPSSSQQSKVQCAFLGVQDLLTKLPQCAQVSPTTGNCTAYNQVSLFTFPNVAANSVSNLTTCTGSGSGQPTIVPYTTPNPSSWTGFGSSTNPYSAPTGGAGTYQITTFSDGYAGSSTGTLSSSSGIVIATGGTTGNTCTGIQTPGGDGTYYAGAINQAQEALMGAASGTNSKMIMIIMSDGDADSTKICKTWSASNPGTCTAYASGSSATYGSSLDQCQQAIAAAQNATSLGTTVYTIAYQSSTSGCGSDSSDYPGITGSGGSNLESLSPCTTMEWMSSGWPSNTSHFYSDGSSASACGVGGYTIPTIFSQIEASFGAGRLIPNS